MSLLNEQLNAIRDGQYKPPGKVITVRMTTDLHERLTGVAHDQRMSMNQLCIAALEAAVRQLGVVTTATAEKAVA